MPLRFRPFALACVAALVLAGAAYTLRPSYAQASATVTIDTTTRFQIIDGFGTCLAGTGAQSADWQKLYYDDLGASILRVDLTPNFAAPYSDFTYNSPWFHNNPALPGPDDNNVRSYTSPEDYSREWSGRRAPIAVMKADATQNQSLFDFSAEMPQTGITAAKAGSARKTALGDFKLIASIWSPAPWLKVASGNTIGGQSGIGPRNGTAWPFIWGGNFAGGKLDVSNTPLAVFNDGVQNTSALTQFARSTAAYVLGYQRAAGVSFYAISIQNELNFETFYNSMTYPMSPEYITALKAVRAEFDKYPELKPIKIMGPEDLLGGDAYGMWEYGPLAHKNLQYLKNIEADPAAAEAVDFYNIHGYAGDGVSAAGAVPQLWDWWANGWTASPAAGIPGDVKGFTSYGKKSWMTETSGEAPVWLSPSSGFPGNGAWSVALRVHQALTAGQQSAWVYWQLSDGGDASDFTLTDKTLKNDAPKYVAVKHFAKYIRPNAQRVQASVAGSTTIEASAYIHDANKTLTTVLINSSATAQTMRVRLPSAPAGISTLQTFTSSDGSMWKSGSAAVQNGEVTVTIPGYGVTTLYGTGSGGTAQPTATSTTPTPTLPACPTAAPVATPQGARPRAFLPLTSGGGTAKCR
ncbi:MAG: hypothetical protein H7Z42_02405 [Roseiflexaceae bacterium]|nr:hypothetical protein [Roseiflexaceae bacterium]